MYMMGFQFECWCILGHPNVPNHVANNTASLLVNFLYFQDGPSVANRGSISIAAKFCIILYLATVPFKITTCCVLE